MGSLNFKLNYGMILEAENRVFGEKENLYNKVPMKNRNKRTSADKSPLQASTEKQQSSPRDALHS